MYTNLSQNYNDADLWKIRQEEHKHIEKQENMMEDKQVDIFRGEKSTNIRQT